MSYWFTTTVTAPLRQWRVASPCTVVQACTCFRVVGCHQLLLAPSLVLRGFRHAFILLCSALPAGARFPVAAFPQCPGPLGVSRFHFDPSLARPIRPIVTIFRFSSTLFAVPFRFHSNLRTVGLAPLSFFLLQPPSAPTFHFSEFLSARSLSRRVASLFQGRDELFSAHKPTARLKPQPLPARFVLLYRFINGRIVSVVEGFVCCWHQYPYSPYFCPFGCPC